MVWWRHISTLDTTFAANWFHPGGIVGQPTRHLDLATRVYSGCHVSLQFGQKGLTLRNISNENRDKYVSLHVPHIFLPICLVCCTKEVNSLLPWSSIPSSFSFFARVESYLMGIVINPTSRETFKGFILLKMTFRAQYLCGTLDFKIMKPRTK